MGFDILKKTSESGRRGTTASDKCLEDTNGLSKQRSPEAKQQSANRIAEDEDKDGDNSTQNLDSGYAWLILIVMFLLQSSISGASRVYGIVYAKEVAIDYYDREQASWPIATASAVENLAGILTPTLASYLSWRKIELLSTGLFIIANLLAYYSSSLTLDIIALGLIQGLALSTCTVLSLVINNDYFERYRTTAYGISMSGSTFGVLYLTPLVSWLLETYEDFRLVYLALAMVFCINIVLVLFIKPRAETIKKGDNNLASSKEQEGELGETDKEIDKIRGILEILGQDQRDEPRNGNESSAGNTMRVQAARKRSRFEDHFERKNSIASISYRARSRRQSVLSRQHIAPPSVQQSNVYSIEISNSPNPADVHGMIRKSQSGIDLALNGSKQQLPRKISVKGMRSHPVEMVDHQRATTQLAMRQRQMSKLSIAPSVKSLTISEDLNRNVDQDNDDSRSIDNTNGHNPMTAVDLESGSISNEQRYGGGGGADDMTSPSLLLQSKQQYLLNVAAAAADSSRQQQKMADDRGVGVSEADDAGGFSMERTVKLLKLPYLHCTWIMLAIYYLVARIFVIILVDFAADHGFSMSDATSFLNYWSIGELCGRVLLAPFIDLQYMSCKNCIVLTCSLLAASITCIVVIESYLVYAICSMLIAALISLEYMLINVLMVEYLGKEQVTNCYSLAACISAIVLFARPSLIGLFRDHLGSYDGLLLLLAAFAFSFSIIFYLLEPILIRYWPKKVILK